MKQSIVDFSPIASMDLSELTLEFEDINSFEFNEELEYQLDLKKAESVMSAKINNILNTGAQEDNIISYAIDSLLSISFN